MILLTFPKAQKHSLRQYIISLEPGENSRIDVENGNGNYRYNVVIVLFLYFIGSDAESAVGENNTKVQFGPEKTDQVHYTRFY